MITEAWRVLMYYDKRRLNAALCIFEKTLEQVLLFLFCKRDLHQTYGCLEANRLVKFHPNSTNRSRVINVF